MPDAERHEMTYTSTAYSMQYGYGHHYRIQCSCGLDRSAGSEADDESRKHREEIINERLGLSFDLRRKNEKE